MLIVYTDKCIIVVINHVSFAKYLSIMFFSLLLKFEHLNILKYIDKINIICQDKNVEVIRESFVIEMITDVCI